MICQNKCLYPLSWDANKGIALITYDRYSMPMSLQFTNGNTTEYVHSATGEKLKAVHRTAVPNISVPVGSTVALDASNTLSVDSTTYAGDFVFENGQLSKYLFDGGYATFANGQPVWHYYYRDHLGNVRAVVSHDGTVEQRNHYYPFGAVYGDVAYNDGLQKYKYNGKELDRMHGLNFYDYGARQYDPLLGMFTQMDPLAEKYYGISPYAYCENNPVNAIDPDGRDWFKDIDNTYQYSPYIKSQSDLSMGQTYLWSSKYYKNTSYREDGSILYKNETTAYKRIWDQADRHYRTASEPRGREVGAFILSGGQVLVLPDYANDYNSSKISSYGYSINSKGVLKHGNESFNVIAQIHTHQKGSGDSTPSFYGTPSDASFSNSMGARPVLVMGYDKKLHGIISNADSFTVMRFPSPFNSLDYILNGGNQSLYKFLYERRNSWPIKNKYNEKDLLCDFSHFIHRL